MKDDSVYLRYILQCIAQIERYNADAPRVFLESDLVRDATLRNLQTMAESTQRLSDELKASHPEVDWRALSGFRDVLVHDYLGIDLHLVHQALENEIPRLKSAVETMLRSLQKN